MSQKNIDVLIVGAGAIGLFCANEVLRHGMTCRIIDKKSTLGDYAEGLALDKRTIEVLEDCGFVTEPTIHTAIEAVFNQGLQDKGKLVDWNTEFTHLSQSPTEITATIKKPNNRIELFNATWLIACDGRDSTVKQQVTTGFNQTQQLQYDRVFLAGNAAHSPVEGQDLNMGIQDIYNLVWKLALVERRKANPVLLASYHAERFPVGQERLNTADKMTQFFLRCFRLGKNRQTNEKEAFAAPFKQSQTQQNSNSRALRAGAFFPDFPLIDYATQENYNSKAVVQGTLHHLFIFCGPKTHKAKDLLPLAKTLATRYGKTMQVHLVLPQKIDLHHATINTWVADPAAQQQVGIKKPTMVLVRPDKYIGLLKKSIKPHAVLKEFYIVP